MVGEETSCAGVGGWYGSYSFSSSFCGASLGGGTGGGAVLGISPDFLDCFAVWLGGGSGGTSRGADTFGRGGGPLAGGPAISFSLGVVGSAIVSSSRLESRA
jgi:hypothetical protein